MKAHSIMFVAAVLVVASACEKKDGPAATSGSGAATASGSAGSAVNAGSAIGAGSAMGSDAGSASAEAAGAGKLPNIDCAKAIPQSVVDKYFKGIPTKHNEPISGFSDHRSDTTCRFVIDEKTNTKILIDYHCGGEFADLDAYLENQNKHLQVKYKRVPGIGRGGFTDSVSTFGVQHRSLPCMIMVDLAFLDDKDPLRKKDYMALLRELEASLSDAP